MLQRQMEMRHHPEFARQQFRQFIIDLAGVERR